MANMHCRCQFGRNLGLLYTVQLVSRAQIHGVE
jgi:hypothetical protein